MEYAEMKHSFDTHKHIKALIAQGMQEAQAETIVSTIVESKEFDLSKLATKEQLALVQKDIDSLKKDIEYIKNNTATKEELHNVRIELQKDNEALRQELKKDNQLLKQELKADIANVKTELKKDNEVLRQEVKADLASLRAEVSSVKFDILKWIIPFMLTNTIAILGIIVAVFFRG
jgi:hypothetical protein